MLTDKQIAGILFVLLACLPIGIWIIFLFVGNTPNANPIDQFEFALSEENQHHGFFVWLAVAVLLSVGLAVVWFLSRSVSLTLVIVVAVVSLAQASGYLAWSQWLQAMLSLLPLVWVYRTYKNRPNPLSQPTP